MGRPPARDAPDPCFASPEAPRINDKIIGARSRGLAGRQSTRYETGRPFLRHLARIRVWLEIEAGPPWNAAPLRGVHAKRLTGGSRLFSHWLRPIERNRARPQVAPE